MGQAHLSAPVVHSSFFALDTLRLMGKFGRMKKIILFVAMTFFFNTQLSAKPITLAWDYNPEVNIAHYTLKYGTVSGVYTNSVQTSTNEAVTPDLAMSVRYYFVVAATNTDGIEGPASDEVSYIETTRPTSPYGWQTKFCDSEETGGYESEYAFDGDPATFWHTALPNHYQDLPHVLQINLGSVKTLRGFTYLPRQDSSTSGNIQNYEFLTSVDGITWTLRKSGAMPSGIQKSEILFPIVTAKYISLRILSEISGEQSANIAEIGLLEPTDTSDPISAPQNVHFY